MLTMLWGNVVRTGAVPPTRAEFSCFPNFGLGDRLARGLLGGLGEHRLHQRQRRSQPLMGV